MLMSAIIICTALASTLPGSDLFLAADAFERSAKHDSAQKGFLECATQSPELAPYALSRAAYNHYRAGNMEAAHALFGRVLTDYPEGPWVRLTQARLGTLYLEKMEREQARTHLNAALSDLDPIPWFLDSLAWNRADNALALPQYADEGHAFFRRVAETTIYLTPRRDAAQRLSRSPAMTDRIVAAYGLARSGNLKEARDTLYTELLGLRGPENTSLPLITLDVILSGVQTDAVAARSNIESFMRDNADHFWLRVWVMIAVREQSANKRYDAAEMLAGLFAQYFPEGRDAGDVYWLLSERYESDGLPQRADRMYRLLADTFPDHVRAPRSRYNLANRANDAGRYDEARALYEELGAAYPQSRFAAEGFYRCASVAGAQADTEREEYFLTRAAGVGLGHFHAHRALHRLRQILDIRPANARSLRIAGADDFMQPFPVKEGLDYRHSPVINQTPVYQRLIFFGTNGLEEGEWEALHCIVTTTESGKRLWYPVLADAGFMHTLVQFAQAEGWGLHDGQPGTDRLRIEYPLSYWPEMKSVAKELELDPFLLLAIAKQESTFRAGVVSRAGATGVLQLMPATARWLADVDGRISHDHVRHLKSPVNSIRLGAVYMHRMLNRSGGNQAYALASYNAGPGNFDKWRVRFPNHALEEFIEAIPFAETNDYVKKVLANYAAYHSLYPPPGGIGE